MKNGGPASSQPSDWPGRVLIAVSGGSHLHCKSLSNSGRRRWGASSETRWGKNDLYIYEVLWETCSVLGFFLSNQSIQDASILPHEMAVLAG